MFENVDPGTYRVGEEMKEGWMNTTPNPASATVDPDSVTTVHFGNYEINPAISIEKSGPVIAGKNSDVVYKYGVTNAGNVPLTEVTVEDDKCSPVEYVSGDDGDNVLEDGETWMFECTTTLSWSFPESTMNTAEAKGKFKEMEVSSEDDFTLYPFVLRKNVVLYWEGTTIDYSDPDTEFEVEIRKGDVVLGTVMISESSPKSMWLSEGTYQFCEVNLLDGFSPASSLHTSTSLLASVLNATQ